MDVGADYDDLGGRGKEAQVRELVAWAERTGKWEVLLAAVKAACPDIAAIANLLPPHHIPFHQNELFTGREEVLADLEQRLHGDNAAAVTVAVTGLGGTGKTQVALAYCYRHLAAYDLIYWLPADEPTTLGIALAEMAIRLGLAPRQTDHNTLRQLVLGWLQTTEKRWLLIFDNADQIDPAALRPLLPRLGNGANLITTRNPNWGGLAQTVPLGLFTETEAMAFLLGQRPRTAQNEAEAGQLAARLGYLLLALEHARAYAEATGCSLADYAGYFATERQALWAEADPPADYAQRTVATTWEESGRLLPHLLAVLKVANGEGVEETAVADLNNAAGVYLYHLGNYEAAQPYMERTLAIFTAKLGENHPHTQIARRNLAALLCDMGASA